MASAQPRDGQQEPNETNSRDAFTVKLLKHVADKLGVRYTGDRVDASDSIVMGELGRLKAEIRSRERALGVDNMSLIPLYVKAANLSPTTEDVLRFHRKAVEVVEANQELKKESTIMNAISVSDLAELGSSLFRHGEYHLAERLFTMAASICHAKSAGVCEAASSSTSKGCSPNRLRRLKGHLWDWQKSAEAAQQDLSKLLSVAAQKPHRQREVRDAFSQTELAEHGATMPGSQETGAMKKMRELKGIRNAEDLKRLVEYTLDPMNGEDGFNCLVLPKRRTTTTPLQSGRVPASSPLLALRESIDRVASRVDGKLDSINLSSGALGKGLPPR
ncbi:uncharacterized protein Tco025E_05258 [Trypanosoma conorhini]|uniref:Uncharacterized protein n=1 Tax=Trypanosoma conorhini TaxID=83891 RepID=A0A3R7KZ78_9TRYP|nr:uncharacterized protein Tco025E_05258 [Trypanosoma conorhini]RNF16345.1 hypothetical protein Tco025E_05258 [Trypanosoma conorhini]